VFQAEDTNEDGLVDRTNAFDNLPEAAHTTRGNESF
jgi:hypothetical protein